jgi:predicted metal-binding membrane protein
VSAQPYSATTDVGALESLLRRDRMIVLTCLAVVSAVAWAYLVVLGVQMAAATSDGGSSGMADMVRLKPWTALDAALMLVMWAVMMVGMMVPSATPMILLYARVRRKRARGAWPYVPTGAFLLGYLVAWTGFSAMATALQWALEQAALLSPMMVSASPLFGGAVLISAGLYQVTPAKQACLRRCRSPVEFLSRHWRHGAWGAFVMGVVHGTFCVGCCWILMGLLFVGGVMNLLWVLAIAVFVLIEKVAPYGHLTGRVAGAVLAGAGLYLIVQA